MGQPIASAIPVPQGRPHYPLLGVAAILLGAFIVGFDTRLFGVGLPDLRAAFGLTFDEGAWLNTVATAPQIILAPAVVWLATVFGLRRVMVGPSLVYVAISLGIPFVRDYHTLLMLHFVHGLLLGVFIPAVIMVVLSTLPKPWWIVALAIYSFRLAFTSNAGVAVADYYAQHAGWQWLYWQGAVSALVMLLLTWLGMPDRPVDRALLGKADWGGMLLFGTGLALIFAGLDQGNRLDWFESGTVSALLIGGLVLFALFFVNEAVVAEPWASARVLYSRNFSLVMLAIAAYMATSLSNVMLVPNFLTFVGGFRPDEAGALMLSHVALPLFVTVPVAVYLLYRIDARIVAIVGFIAFAVAAWMGTGLTHAWRADDFALLALVQSVGQGFTFTALLIFALANASPTQGVAIIAYIQMMRLDVLALMTSGMATWLRLSEQIHSHLIGLHVQAGDVEVTQFLARLTKRFLDHGATETAQARAALTLAGLVRREANVLSLIDGFTIAFWAALIGLLLIALMRAAPPGPLTPQRQARP